MFNNGLTYITILIFDSMKTPLFNYLAPDSFMIYKVMKYSSNREDLTIWWQAAALTKCHIHFTSRVLQTYITQRVFLTLKKTMVDLSSCLTMCHRSYGVHCLTSRMQQNGRVEDIFSRGRRNEKKVIVFANQTFILLYLRNTKFKRIHY